MNTGPIAAGVVTLAYESPRGASVEWFTPPRVFAELGLSFDLDPAAPPGGVPWVPARRSYCRTDDGLLQPWEGRVWLNPPYGPGIARWLSKLGRHGDGVALVFARTDTRWFQAAAREAGALCFVARRLSFLRGDGRPAGAAAAPSVLLGYGDTCASAVRHCGLGLSTQVSLATRRPA